MCIRDSIHGDGVPGKDAHGQRIAGGLSGRTGLSAFFRAPAQPRKLRTAPDVPPRSFVPRCVEQGTVCVFNAVQDVYKRQAPPQWQPIRGRRRAAAGAGPGQDHAPQV